VELGAPVSELIMSDCQQYRRILTLSPVGNCPYLTLGTSAPTRSRKPCNPAPSAKSGEMKTASRLDRKLQLAFGVATLTLLVVGAISNSGFRVPRYAGLRRLDV